MADEEPPELLSPELVASLGVAGGDAMLTSAKKKQKPGGGGGAKHGPRRGNALPAVKKLSKSQKRKLAKVEEDKRKREQRAGVVARLNAAKLVSDESLTLLRGSDRMGQKMSKRETLRRELKAERAGIALPGTEHSRLLKRERPRDDAAGAGGESSDSDASEANASDAEDAEKATFGRKQSWPNKALTPSTTPPPKASYGPIHPLDQARLDAARVAEAERDAWAGDDEARLPEGGTDGKAVAAAASETARAASRAALAAARALSERVRALDPEQEAERRVAALGPNAAAAAYDPKDAAAKMAAANEAAAAAAAARYPGVFVGASRCVPVTRDAEVVAAREGLPILGAEHEIVDAINSNPVVVLCGETGCGKTTQVPQFLFEAGYGDPSCDAHPGAVAVTQPRRVAVTSTATRVARELNVTLGREVGYQVRYDKKVARENETRLKFMTDGILLREMRADLLLRRYSVIIVDEAHERGVNTDILLGLLSRVVPLRAELFREGRAGITPLRLVVMSATLRVEEFVENKKLCPTPPALLRIQARQFPVTNHFARETVHADYVSAARKKVLAIHRKLPPGGILVFVTGQKEVERLCAKLRRAHPAPAAGGEARSPRAAGAETRESKQEDEDKDEDEDEAAPSGLDAFGADVADDAGEEDWDGEDVSHPATDRDDFDDASDDDNSDGESDVSEEDDVVVRAGEGVTPEAAAEAEAAWVRAHAPTTVAAASASGKATEPEGPGYLHVLPLYAMLPPHLQKRVFDPPPPGARAVVVATNVAETSLTIPGTRYVVDCGREKQRVFGGAEGSSAPDADAAAQSAGVSRFSVAWVSQASAEQRSGRAGRTGPGHCYRLFSSAHFVNELEPHAPPAIARVPVDGVVLQMRAMGIDKIERFPFLTPPEPGALRRAQRTLAVLGALRPSGAASQTRGASHGHFGAFGDDGDVGVLTDLGEAMAALPVGPRHARMLLAAAHSGVEGCLAAAVAAAAALSLDSPFLRDDDVDAARSGETAEAGEEAEARDAKDARKTPEQSRGKLRRRFHHPHSDALSAARALVAYDAEPASPREAERFCRDHCLHGRTMREASDLRRQLLRALASPSAARAFPRHARDAVARAAAFLRARRSERRRAFPPFGEDPALAALRVAGERRRDAKGDESKRGDSKRADEREASPADGDVALRRALLRGWADRVARRVKPSEETASELSVSTRTRARRYKPAMHGDTVYLHPSSSLHKTSPEYVAYADLLATEKRAYLGGATAVDASWLCDDAAALTSLSAPLEDPAPRYVQREGHVVAFAQPHFGAHRWPLPLRADRMRADEGGCGAFAAALLSGAVSAPMADLREKMAAKPSLCARAEGKAQRRVGDIVHALQVRDVASKEALRAQWRREPAYLMREARAWMKRGHEHVLERAWPRVVAAALREEATKVPSSNPRGGGGGAVARLETGTRARGDGTAREPGTEADERRAKPAGPRDGVGEIVSASFSGSAPEARERRAKSSRAEAKKRRANPAALDAGLSIWD